MLIRVNCKLNQPGTKLETWWMQSEFVHEVKVRHDPSLFSEFALCVALSYVLAG